MENYYCFSSANETFLPRQWRSELIRQRETRSTPPTLAGDEYKAAVLHELWEEYDDILPEYFELTAGLKAIPSLSGKEKEKAEGLLRSKLHLFNRQVLQFVESPRFIEVCQQLPAPSPPFPLPKDFHRDCGCPPPPFQPVFSAFPPAGGLHLVCICIEVMITLVPSPILLKPPPSQIEDAQSDTSKSDLLKDIAEHHVYDLCRIFAGLEITYSHTPDFLLPSYTSLLVAAFACPLPLRRWLGFKLAHMEESYNVYSTSAERMLFQATRQVLANIWEMPSLVKRGFRAWCEEPPVGETRDIDPADIGLAARIEELNLGE